MASKELNVKIKQRYDTASKWTTNNPVLLAGELGIESDTKKMKVGDGITSWIYLDYMVAEPESVVNSINGKTGDVELTAEDIGALPSDTPLFSGNYNDLSDKPTIPTTASDVNALPDTIKYGSSIDLSIDSTTYIVTAQLKDQNGNNLGTAKTIDLPLESVVVSGSYDATNKKVILTLKDGSTIDFSVADLVSGLQKEITSTNKLSANLISGLSLIAKSGSYGDLLNIPTNIAYLDANQEWKGEQLWKNYNTFLTTTTFQKKGSNNRVLLGKEEDGFPVIGINSNVQKFQDKSGTIALLDDIPTDSGGTKIIWREWT